MSLPWRQITLVEYEAGKAVVPQPKFSEDCAKQCGLTDVRELSSVLSNFGNAVATLPRENCVETADLLVEIVAEAASALATISYKKTDSEAYVTDSVAITKALILKCQVQAIQRAKQSPSYSDNTKAILRKSEVQYALDVALSFIGYEHPDNAWNSANILDKLLPKYVHSLTAIYGTAPGLLSVYVEYADSVLSEMKSEIKSTAYCWRVRTWILSFWR